ncbi:hypothetical protein [Aestuariivirga sp.]|uniref:hypothetical protein n=1 Tax=Aestuariivirga sp. TaxID=2650926 RepID=UPI003BAD1711
MIDPGSDCCDYGPDSERTAKSFLGQTRYFLGADADVAFDAATPQGLLTSYLYPDVKREGIATDFLLKDHLASNRLSIRMAVNSGGCRPAIIASTISGARKARRRSLLISLAGRMLFLRTESVNSRS